MPSTELSTDEDTGTPGRTQIPGIVDWLAAALFVITGLGLIGAGLGLRGSLDRAAVSELVASGAVQHEPLSDQAATEVILSVGDWASLGLLIGGAVVILGGIAFGAYTATGRGRTPTGAATGTRSVALGVAATIVLFFIPATPAVGGAITGYVAPPGRGTRLGAATGLLAILPGLFVPSVLGLGFLIDAPAVGTPDLLSAIGWVLLASVPVGVVLGLIVGGIGGYLGTWLANRSRTG
ncbi:MAG: DUF5518 domain-containing protein [Halobacteriaceae archaeon]